jgi:hypothetical protein
LVLVGAVGCGGGESSEPKGAAGPSSAKAAVDAPSATEASGGVLDALTCGELDRHFAAVEAYLTAFESLDPLNPEHTAKLAQLGMEAGKAAMALGGVEGLSPACQAKALAMQDKYRELGERSAAAAAKKTAEIEAKLGPEMKKMEALTACMQGCQEKPPEAMGACMEACAR